MALNCAGKFGMVFLVIINILFLLLGLGLFVPGIVMLADVDLIKGEISPLLEQVAVGAYNLNDLTNSLSILFICLGSFVMIVAGLGLCGACCKNKVMLVIYAIIVLLLFLMKVVAIGLWLKLNTEVQNTIKDALTSQLLNNYETESIANANTVSTAWNYLFLTYKCCGVEPVTTTVTGFENTKWCLTAGTQCSTGTYKIPPACCVGITKDTISTASTSCTANLNAGTYYTTGCYDAVKDKITTIGNWFIGIGITVLVIEVLAVIFAFCICHQANGKDQVV